MRLPSDFTGSIAFLSDLQWPFHDERALECAEKILYKFKPTALCAGGDIVDCDHLSAKYGSAPERRTWACVQADFANAGARLAYWAGLTRSKHRIMLGGNHEERPGNLLRAVLPQLDGVLQLEREMGLKLSGFVYVPYEHGNGRVLVGDPFRGLVLLHGFLWGKGKTGRNAVAHMDRLDCSVVHGHTNVCVSVQRVAPHRTLYGVEAGCLCSAEKMAEMYAPVPDQQQGIGWLELERGRLVRAEAVRISDGRAHFNGASFRA